METFNDSFLNSEMLQRKTAHLMSGNAKGRIEVRRMEEKVARVAAKKCSVEEITALYKELEEWLLTEKDDQVRIFFLFPHRPIPSPLRDHPYFFQRCCRGRRLRVNPTPFVFPLSSIPPDNFFFSCAND